MTEVGISYLHTVFQIGKGRELDQNCNRSRSSNHRSSSSSNHRSSSSSNHWHCRGRQQKTQTDTPPVTILFPCTQGFGPGTLHFQYY